MSRPPKHECDGCKQPQAERQVIAVPRIVEDLGAYDVADVLAEVPVSRARCPEMQDEQLGNVKLVPGPMPLSCHLPREEARRIGRTIVVPRGEARRGSQSGRVRPVPAVIGKLMPVSETTNVARRSNLAMM